MDLRAKNRVQIADLNNNLLKKNRGRPFLVRLNIALGFKERSKNSLIILVIAGLIVTGLVGSFFFFRQPPDTASASLIQDDLLDATFGESGQIPTVEIENKTFLNPKFLEYQQGLIAVGTATDKVDTNLKQIAVVYINNDGSLNRQFNPNGFSIISYENKNKIEVVDAIILNENIFVLSALDDCYGLSSSQSCGAGDVLVTRLSIDGKKIENYGKNGLAQFNLSENTNLSKPGEREDFPVSIIGFSGGRIAFLSSYQYQNKETFVTGFKVVYLDNKGLLDNEKADKGIQKFSHKDYPELTKNDEYQNLAPMAMTLTDRNSARIEFMKGNNTYGEIILDSFGKIRKINSNDINLITADTKIFGGSEVKLKARKSITGKIIFYGTCNPKENQGWLNLCLARYFATGELDNSFAKSSDSVFKLEFIGGDFIVDNGISSFLEDPITQQLAISFTVRTAQNTKTSNETILLKPTGQFNTNFANKGIWRTATNLVIKNFLTTGKLIAADTSKIYRLAKPLFIDPVITKINPNSASTVGGLKVTIEGDNFIKNPDNPKFTEAKSAIKMNTAKSVISNYYTLPDKQGGTFAVGNFSGNLSLKDKTYQTEENRSDIFISRLNSDGEVVWGNHGGGLKGDDTALKIALDKNQNLYILGSTNSDISLFNGPQTPSEGSIFLAKYTSSGQFSWIKRLEGKLSSTYSDLAIENENIIVAGNFVGDLKLDTSVVNSRENQGFVASFKSGNGGLNWLQTVNSDSQNQIRKIQTSEKGEILAFGTTNGKLNIGFDNVRNLGSTDIFVLKYDTTGRVNFAQLIGGAGIDDFEDAILTKNGETILSGDFSANPISNIENNGGFFIVKLLADGKIAWATPGRGLLKEDNSENVIVYGLFEDELFIGAEKLTETGQNLAFSGKINKDGKLLWVSKWGSREATTINDVYIDKDDHVYFSGLFKETANMNNILLTAQGESDIYLIKFNQTGDQVWVKQAGGKNQDLNFKFTSNKEAGDIKFLALVNGLSTFDKLVVPSDLSFNLVSGNLYDQDLSVYFGDKLASKLEIVDTNKLLITVPSNIEGLTDVTVIGYDGSQTVFPNSFDYTTSVTINLDQNPNSGSGTSKI